MFHKDKETSDIMKSLLQEGTYQRQIVKAYFDKLENTIVTDLAETTETNQLSRLSGMLKATREIRKAML